MRFLFVLLLCSVVPPVQGWLGSGHIREIRNDNDKVKPEKVLRTEQTREAQIKAVSSINHLSTKTIDMDGNIDITSSNSSPYSSFLSFLDESSRPESVSMETTGGVHESLNKGSSFIERSQVEKFNYSPYPGSSRPLYTANDDKLRRYQEKTGNYFQPDNSLPKQEPEDDGFIPNSLKKTVGNALRTLEADHFPPGVPPGDDVDDVSSSDDVTSSSDAVVENKSTSSEQFSGKSSEKNQKILTPLPDPYEYEKMLSTSIKDRIAIDKGAKQMRDGTLEKSGDQLVEEALSKIDPDDEFSTDGGEIKGRSVMRDEVGQIVSASMTVEKDLKSFAGRIVNGFVEVCKFCLGLFLGFLNPFNYLELLGNKIAEFFVMVFADPLRSTVLIGMILFICASCIYGIWLADKTSSRHYPWAPIYMNPTHSKLKKKVVEHTEFLLDPSSPHHRRIYRERNKHLNDYYSLHDVSNKMAKGDNSSGGGGLPNLSQFSDADISESQKLLFISEPSFRERGGKTPLEDSMAKFRENQEDKDIETYKKETARPEPKLPFAGILLGNGGTRTSATIHAGVHDHSDYVSLVHGTAMKATADRGAERHDRRVSMEAKSATYFGESIRQQIMAKIKSEGSANSSGVNVDSVEHLNSVNQKLPSVQERAEDARAAEQFPGHNPSLLRSAAQCGLVTKKSITNGDDKFDRR